MFFHSVVLASNFIRVVTLWSAHRHLSDRPFFLGTNGGFRWCSTIAPTRRSLSALLEDEAVDRYPYAWVRTGEGLAPRRFSSQNFFLVSIMWWGQSLIFVNNFQAELAIDPRLLSKKMSYKIWPKESLETNPKFKGRKEQIMTLEK